MSKTEEKGSDEVELCKKDIEQLQQRLAKLREDNNPIPLHDRAKRPPAVGLATCALKQRKVLKALSGKVSATAWANDSLHLLSATQDGKIIVWNGFTINKDYYISMESAWLMTIAYSPDNKFVATGGLDNCCTLFKLPPPEEYPTHDQKVFSKLQKHEGYLSCTQFLDDEQVLTASGDKTCMLWDLEGNTPKSVFKGHTGDVSCVRVINQNIFVTGSTDNTAKMWDKRVKGGCIMTYTGHEQSINALSVFPSGVAFATGGDDCSVRLFDTRAHRQVNLFAFDNFEFHVTSCDFSKTGRLLFVSYASPMCMAWDTLNAEVVDELQGHEDHVSACVVSPNGKALVTASWDLNLSIWA